MVPFKDATLQGPEAALTFAPLPVEGPKHHQVSCVGHGALVQIVLLHFQPVALSRLISSLRGDKRDHKRAWRHRDGGLSPAHTTAGICRSALPETSSNPAFRQESCNGTPSSTSNCHSHVLARAEESKGRDHLTFTSFSTSPSSPSRITLLIMSTKSEAFCGRTEKGSGSEVEVVPFHTLAKRLLQTC